ncbi:MAG: hypothetical protein RLO80_07120 [Hyphomonas sp.]
MKLTAALISMTAVLALSPVASAAVPAGLQYPSERLSDRNCAVELGTGVIACVETPTESPPSEDWLVTQIARLSALHDPSVADRIMLKEYQERLSSDHKVVVIKPIAD